MRIVIQDKAMNIVIFTTKMLTFTSERLPPR